MTGCSIPTNSREAIARVSTVLYLDIDHILLPQVRALIESLNYLRPKMMDQTKSTCICDIEILARLVLSDG